MSSESIITIDLGIAETIQVIDAILSRRQNRDDNRKEDFVQNVKDDIELVSLTVNALDNAFIILVQKYGDEAVIGDPRKLKVLVQETDNYLKRRDLLPKLQIQVGAINAASHHRFVANTKAQEILEHLAVSLKDYRDRLGYGITGVGHGFLEQLQYYAQNNPNQTLLSSIANQAFRQQDFGLSGHMNNLIGLLRYELSSIA